MDEEVKPEEITPKVVPEAPARHPLHDMMKGYNPDKEYPDDNSVMDDAHAKMAELSEYQTKNEAKNAELIAALVADPDLKALVVGAVNKIPARVMAAKIWGPEGLTAEEGDPDFEQVTAAHRERLSKKGEDDAYIAELEQNIQESQSVIEAFAEENGMDEEGKVSFLGNVTQVLTDAYNGKITPDFLARMYTAENHEKEVAAAAENGVIEGKNMAIEEKKAIERDNRTGDGLPTIAAGVTKVEPTVTKRKSAARNFLEGTGI